MCFVFCTEVFIANFVFTVFEEFCGIYDFEVSICFFETFETFGDNATGFWIRMLFSVAKIGLKIVGFSDIKLFFSKKVCCMFSIFFISEIIADDTVEISLFEDCEIREDICNKLICNICKITIFGIFFLTFSCIIQSLKSDFFFEIIIFVVRSDSWMKGGCELLLRMATKEREEETLLGRIEIIVIIKEVCHVWIERLFAEVYNDLIF